MEEKKITLAILNITSWCGQCADATHVYGDLILCSSKQINIDNVDEWGVRSMGEATKMTRPLTLELAKALDEKDGHKSNQRAFRIITEDPDFAKENPEYGTTERFDTFEEVVNVGIEKWKELDIDCPFISLYEGDKYKANSYNPYSTVILQYNKS